MEEKPKNLEFWLRGPVPDVPAPLQPVAHALLQAREEVFALMQDFPDELLWEKPAGMASPGFHLQHLSGVLDRLFTYARAQALSPEQLENLGKEGKPDPALTVQILAQAFHRQVDQTLIQLQETNENLLLETRLVGRAQIPSTVMGLLFHAAEHTMRHVGQLLVTVRVLMSRSE